MPSSLPLEEKAVRQLLAFAGVRRANGHAAACRACATPDFHPGGIAPVGSIVATDADVVIPSSMGTDINCGMRLVTTSLGLATFKRHEARLIERLTHMLLRSGRNIPLQANAFRALFDNGPLAFIDSLDREGLWATVDRDRLAGELAACIGR